MGTGDAGLQIVRHQHFRHPAKELERTDVRRDPVGQSLAPGGLAEGVAAGPQHGHEHFGEPHLPGAAVRHRNRVAGIIDELLFTRFVDLAHHRVLTATPLKITVAELGVLQPVKVVGFVFLPQKEPCHPLAPKLLVDVIPVR